MATMRRWDYGHVDHVGAALGKLRAAQEAVSIAEEQGRQLVADARARVGEARVELAEKIVAEYLDGARVSDLAKRSEYNRETIRRILRAAGIEPA
jgi:hypothetical protein